VHHGKLFLKTGETGNAIHSTDVDLIPGAATWDEITSKIGRPAGRRRQALSASDDPLLMIFAASEIRTARTCTLRTSAAQETGTRTRAKRKLIYPKNKKKSEYRFYSL